MLKLILIQQWMQRIIASGQRQILLDVAVLEVSVSDGGANGINWKTIYDEGGVSH